jgi:hypothetical protein
MGAEVEVTSASIIASLLVIGGILFCFTIDYIILQVETYYKD